MVYYGQKTDSPDLKEDKMKKRTFAVLSVLLAVCLLFAGCGSSPREAAKTDSGNYGGSNSEAQSAYYTASFTSTAPAPQEDALSEAEKTSDGKTSSVPTAAVTQNSQKLIKTLKVSIETLDFDESLNQLNALIFENEGYVESSTVGGTGYNNRSRRTAQFVIRIPAEKLDQAQSALSKIGNVTSSTSEVSDVTLTWADTEGRIKALEAQRDSLLSMLEKADNLSDLLQIQDHLTEVEYRLESAASQMRALENKVSYSTIRLNLEEVKIYTEEEPETFGQRISRTFKESLQSVGGFFQDLAIFFVGNLPALFCWAVFIALVVIVIRRISRKNKKKKAAAPVVPLQEPPKDLKNGGQ